MISCGKEKHFAMVHRQMFQYDPQSPPPDEAQFDESYQILLQHGTTLHDKIKVQLITKMRGNLRLFQALDRFKNCSLRDQILNIDVKAVQETDTVILSQVDLNDSQQRVVRDISDDVLETPNDHKIHLVHGPPGTGKSQTILALILEIYSKNGYIKLSSKPRTGAIIVCAPSNGAVDTLGRKLIKEKEDANFLGADDLKIVRIGSREMADDVQSYSLHSLAKERKVGNDITSVRARKAVIQEAHVIFGTLNSFGSGNLNHLKQALCVIVDEAGQSTEPELLIPLQLPGARKMVLVGDHYQLPPTVLSDEAKKRHLGISLFDRFRTKLVKSEQESVMLFLDTQYRMVNNIAVYPANYIYDKKLKTPTVNHPKYSKTPEHYKLHAYRVIDTNNHRGSEEKDYNRSVSNRNEALIVAEVCKKILTNSSVRPNDIGIITFYRAQVELIANILKENDELADIEVNTVDGYQGREKEVIILSCVRVDTNNIGFLFDKRRMNVSITRAKYGLYIVGHCNTLGMSSNWKDLIRNAYSRYSVIRISSENYSEQLDSLKIDAPEPIKRDKFKSNVSQQSIKRKSN